jgi:hypothetical protein
MDALYEREAVSFPDRLRAAAHILFCAHCAFSARQLELAEDSLREDCFPPAPALEDAIMRMIRTAEFDPSVDEPIAPAWLSEDGSPRYDGFDVEPAHPLFGLFDIPGEFSLRGWVIIGVIILVSLATSFFGRPFTTVAAAQGMAFLLPVGITVGIVITGYGALFIGSHLKELSERFGLR